MSNQRFFIATCLTFVILLSISYYLHGQYPELSDEKRGTYWDYTLSPDQRALDLISKMTLEEKLSQLSAGSRAIPHLGINEYDWWNEAKHGVARSGRATIFPQAIGLASTFDADFVFRVADAISDEGRAIYHAAQERGNRRRYMGLTFWAPSINIFRDPRWGRGQEVYSEDPYLTGHIGSAFVRGLQGDHPRYLKTAACAKHYVVHSGPEELRHEFNAVVEPKDLYETYLPAFKRLIDEGVVGVMCAYNRTNDEPCCGGQNLLIELLRNELGFEGYLVSDCWALNDFHTHHQYTDNPVESAALAINTSVDLDCGNIFEQYLEEAVKQGLVEESRINSALKTLLKIRINLGMFDPPEMNPYASIPTDVINSDKHVALAREAAQRSIVLLKNENNVLPLNNDKSLIFITGPNAIDQEVLIGNYYGMSPNLVSILEGVVAKTLHGNMVHYNYGVLRDRENPNPIDWASGGAHRADATIAVMGMSPLLEGEEGAAIASPQKGDHEYIEFPAQQVEYFRRLKNNNPNPVILVITGGTPLAFPELHELADAVLHAWYPGEQGGNGVADIIFGDAVPSGKLPVTFPMSTDQLPPYDDYSMVGRTYRYMEEEPLYPFGFGLSYTTFEFKDFKLSKDKINRGESVKADVTVVNSGDYSGRNAVQLYLTFEDASFRVPKYSLKSIKNVYLEPGESKTISFTIDEDMMKVIDMEGKAVIKSGNYRITIGESSPGNRSIELGAAKPVEGAFLIK